MTTKNDAPVCPDWVFLNNSNVHVAKDRGWFKTYTPFKSSIQNSMHFSPSSTPVLGIGTVEIPTKRSPNRTGVSAHGTLHLKQVLHVPDFLCNVIGNCITYDGYRVMLGSNSAKSNGTIQDIQGVNMAYFDPDRPLFSVKVRNQPEGPRLGRRTLQHGEMYMLSCRWLQSERQRWLDFESGNVSGLRQAHASSINPPYTDAEKSFLKTNWGSEYHFLIQHGLKIYRDEDREEGRTILRAMMQKEAEESSDDEDYRDDSDGEEFEDDDLDLEGRQADYNFTIKQLDWIDTYYGNSENFLLSFGLKFYDDEDIEEGKAIVNAFLAEED